MTTTLTVLGGSAASVGSGQGCAGYLVSTESTNVVLDLGPGTLQELRNHTDFRSLGAVVLSHLHVDHMLDVIALRFSLAYNPVRPEQRVPLWLPPGGLEFLGRLSEVFTTDRASDSFFTEVFEPGEYNPEGHLEIGDLTLSFKPTVHFIPCWAVRVHPANSSGDLVYSADTGPAADLVDFTTGAHVLLAEATTPLTAQHALPFAARGHLTVDEATALAGSAGARTLVLTHMFEENAPEASVERARSTFAGEVIHARPGVRVTWP